MDPKDCLSCNPPASSDPLAYLGYDAADRQQAHFQGEHKRPPLCVDPECEGHPGDALYEKLATQECNARLRLEEAWARNADEQPHDKGYDLNDATVERDLDYDDYDDQAWQPDADYRITFWTRVRYTVLTWLYQSNDPIAKSLRAIRAQIYRIQDHFDCDQIPF